MTEDDDELDEEVEEGQEFCPVCNRLNFPGACGICFHYIGGVWEGELSWQSEELRAFVDAWQRFCGLRYKLEHGSAVPESFWESIAKNLRMPQRLITLGNGDEVRALEALEGLVTTLEGKSIETGGMLGGSGNSLYMKNPSELVGIATSYNRLSDHIEQLAKPTSKSAEHPASNRKPGANSATR